MIIKDREKKVKGKGEKEGRSSWVGLIPRQNLGKEKSTIYNDSSKKTTFPRLSYSKCGHETKIPAGNLLYKG